MRKPGSGMVLAICLTGGFALSTHTHAAGVGGNIPPVADAGAPIMVDCDGTTTTVMLDGTGSFDPDGQIASYFWEICANGTLVGQGTATPTVTFNTGGQCLVECTGVFLVVRDANGDSDVDSTSITITDMSAPSITPPANRQDLYTTGLPTQIDPSITGIAQSSDICGGMVSLGYTDSIQNGMPPTGIEHIIKRTWETMDGCGNRATACQDIVIVGPSFFGNACDTVMMPQSCSNNFRVGSPVPFTVVLLGEAGFDARDVKITSLVIHRPDAVGTTLRPLAVRRMDIGGPSDDNCFVSGADGYKDVVLRFDPIQLSQTLQFSGEEDRSLLELRIAGEFKATAGGGLFGGRDSLRLIQP